MARTDPQVNLRMPAELKEALDAEAARNKRSLTAEIVARLQRTVSEAPAISGLSVSELFRRLDELETLIKSGEFVPFSERVRKDSARPDDGTLREPERNTSSARARKQKKA